MKKSVIETPKDLPLPMICGKKRTIEVIKSQIQIGEYVDPELFATNAQRLGSKLAELDTNVVLMPDMTQLSFNVPSKTIREINDIILHGVAAIDMEAEEKEQRQRNKI